MRALPPELEQAGRLRLLNPRIVTWGANCLTRSAEGFGDGTGLRQSRPLETLLAWQRVGETLVGERRRQIRLGGIELESLRGSLVGYSPERALGSLNP
jgi:hypothetical protein